MIHKSTCLQGVSGRGWAEARDRGQGLLLQLFPLLTTLKRKTTSINIQMAEYLANKQLLLNGKGGENSTKTANTDSGDIIGTF